MLSSRLKDDIIKREIVLVIKIVQKKSRRYEDRLN